MVDIPNQGQQVCLLLVLLASKPDTGFRLRLARISDSATWSQWDIFEPSTSCLTSQTLFRLIKNSAKTYPVKGFDNPTSKNSLSRTKLPSMSLYAEYVQLNRGLAFTIYWSSTQTPTRRLGCVGDLFIQEEDNNLFYKVDKEINYVRSTSRHHVFPPAGALCQQTNLATYSILKTVIIG